MNELRNEKYTTMNELNEWYIKYINPKSNIGPIKTIYKWWLTMGWSIVTSAGGWLLMGEIIIYILVPF